MLPRHVFRWMPDPVSLDDLGADGDRLDGLDYVHGWGHVRADDPGHRDVIAFTTPELSEHVAETAESLIGTCDPTVDHDGATRSSVGPRSAISEVIAECDRAGSSPEPHRLNGYAGTEDPLDGLTHGQIEAVRRHTSWAATRSPARRRPPRSPRSPGWTRRPSRNTGSWRKRNRSTPTWGREPSGEAGRSLGGRTATPGRHPAGRRATGRTGRPV